MRHLLIHLRKGLSPRVRGNLQPADRLGVRPGTIPACAGEPPRAWCEAPSTRDYPRVCGGTYPFMSDDCYCPGLSPRVRGNRGVFPAGGRERGTIPACAGEPASGLRRRVPSMDYPRVCGGTL